MKQQIYSGHSPAEAFQTIAEDLGAMQAMVRLACSGNDSRVGEQYIRLLSYKTRDFANLTTHSTPVNWQQTITDRTNTLLREIHLMLRLPQWSYTVVNAWTGHKLIEIWKEVTT